MNSHSRGVSSRVAAWISGLLAFSLIAPSLACSPAPRQRTLQGAVVILLDTLRADHVSAYGYERPTTPVIDRVAQEGVLFENVISNSSWTLPAVVGMLSGRYPTGEVFDQTLTLSLIARLRKAGFQTAAFTEGGFVSRFYGLDRGFETYDEEEGAVRLTVRGDLYHPTARGGIERTFAAASHWLRENSDRPFFLLVHTYEIHTPYRRSDYVKKMDPGNLGETYEISDVLAVQEGKIEITPTEVEYLTGLYDGGVSAADRHVGELLATLEELGLTDRTVVVVTSDHGEDLGNRFPRWAGDHGHTLYDELVRVPLILRNPKKSYPVKRVEGQVRLIDLMPTVFKLLEVDLPPSIDGASLVPLMEGTQGEDRIAFSRISPRHGKATLRQAIRDGNYKLISNAPFADPERPSEEFFDLEADPGETANLRKEPAEPYNRLKDELARMRTTLMQKGLPNYEPKEILPSAHKERLKSLGYVE